MPAIDPCSSLCHPAEPCSLTADGVCDVRREFTEERAAIREYDGLQSRDEAERGAVDDYRRWRDEH